MQAHGPDQDMEMRVKFQITPEGMTDDQHRDLRAVLVFSPILQDLGAKCVEVGEQMPVPLKNRPKITVHSKSNAGTWGVWKGRCTFTLPADRCPLSAARTGPGLAGMREELPLSTVGCVDLSPECKRSAVDHFLEVHADHRPCLRIVPVNPIVGQDLLHASLG